MTRQRRTQRFNLLSIGKWDCALPFLSDAQVVLTDTHLRLPRPIAAGSLTSSFAHCLDTIREATKKANATPLSPSFGAAGIHHREPDQPGGRATKCSKLYAANENRNSHCSRQGCELGSLGGKASQPSVRPTFSGQSVC